MLDEDYSRGGSVMTDAEYMGERNRLTREMETELGRLKRGPTYRALQGQYDKKVAYWKSQGKKVRTWDQYFRTKDIDIDMAPGLGDPVTRADTGPGARGRAVRPAGSGERTAPGARSPRRSGLRQRGQDLLERDVGQSTWFYV